MATLRIEEQRKIGAAPEVVWQHLIDPTRIVNCLPGATLESATDERSFVGRVRVRVGPLSVLYRGTLEFTEMDHEARRVQIVGKGTEQGGAGTASFVMESWVRELPDGSEVAVEADVKLSGRVVRFGRGMIECVATELFTDFSARLEEQIGEGAAELTPCDDDPTPQGDLHGPPVDHSTSPDGDQNASFNPLGMLWRAFRLWITRIFGRERTKGV